jgi:hypothetical protein
VADILFPERLRSSQSTLGLYTSRSLPDLAGFISGSEIAELYTPNRLRLFAMNIRDWVGDTSTNKGIVATAENRPEDFLFFNMVFLLSRRESTNRPKQTPSAVEAFQ